MKKLYTPWRLHYVKSVLRKTDGTPKEECVFCSNYASEDDVAHLILYRGTYCGILMNLYPYSAGHLMVIPFEHIADLSALSSEARAEMFELTNKSIEVLKKTLTPHGFNVGINLGKAAGAGIPSHLHLHIVPRWIGDINFMPIIGETKTISVVLSDMYQQLLPEFKNML